MPPVSPDRITVSISHVRTDEFSPCPKERAVEVNGRSFESVLAIEHDIDCFRWTGTSGKLAFLNSLVVKPCCPSKYFLEQLR